MRSLRYLLVGGVAIAALAGWVFATSQGPPRVEGLPGSAALTGYKELYDFANWPGKDGPIRDGFKLDGAILPEGLFLEHTSGVIVSMDPRTGFLAVCRDYEVTGKTAPGSLDIRLVVTETSAQAQEAIMDVFVNMQVPQPPLFPRGTERGLDLGDICFASASLVVWARNNIFVRVWTDTRDMRPYVEQLARSIDAAIEKRATFNTYAECKSRPAITKVARTPGAGVDWSAVEARDPQGEKLIYCPYDRPGWPTFDLAVNETNLVGFPLSGIAKWKWDTRNSEMVNADINLFLKAYEAPLGRPAAQPPLPDLDSVALDATDVAPLVIKFQDQKGYWPYGEGEGELLLRAGLYQYLDTTEAPYPYILAKLCRFQDPAEATAAADYYIHHLEAGYGVAPFREAGAGRETAGQKCWTTETSFSFYIVFQRGPFCATLGGAVQDRALVVQLAEKLDKNIQAYLEARPPAGQSPQRTEPPPASP